ncbi:hypothetical protein [Botrimarina hoheduenensis]|uniref:Cytidyltransferase-like domain-containing protein n=1 Tax=Botrimarina hoheduenensis TaxID=2528000 RepID=A0A5C5VVN6_9BACT|nr:hypothetical protein [Botrimarina hoheduenensis]TWT42736.1 hypothetical protein Pla111_27090 [Botrimarina hoheduenensis]
MAKPADLPCNLSLEAAVLAAGRRIVLAAAGGGSGAIGRLLGVPGASKSVLEAIAPQAEAALTDWLGAKPEQACSEETARAMAMASWLRARRLAPHAEPRTLIGIGATASLVTDRPKRGEHRLYVAAQTTERTLALSLHLEKGRRTRAEEESVTERALLALLADAAGVRELDLSKSPPGIEASIRRHGSEELGALLSGEQSVWATPDAPKTPRLLLPGSFNPFHEGHARMAAYAEKLLGSVAVFELSLTNVDKLPLDFLEIAERQEGLAQRPLWITAAATFVEKARLAPGCVFAVGADTLQRLADARYCGGDPQERDRQFAEFAERGCRFLVFGRTMGERFVALGDLALPPKLATLCDAVSEEAFRLDVSSTELRANGQPG